MRARVEVRGETLSSRAIICAAPWYAYADVLVDPPPSLRSVVDAACATDAAPIVTVNLWFDRVVMDQHFVGLPGRTMQWVFDKRAIFGDRPDVPPSLEGYGGQAGRSGEQPSHLSLTSSGAEQVVGRSNQELVDLAMAEVTEALPAVRAATLRRAVVVREKRATFSVAPGQPQRPPTGTAVPGLFLAGDWIDTGLPATIESAVVSGHWAAEAALRLIRDS
jgi:hydroxysqualene dehydroxylase